MTWICDMLGLTLWFFLSIFLQDPHGHLEAKLRKQQMESEGDSRWLQQEEHNLVRDKHTHCKFTELQIDHTIMAQKNRLSFITTGSNSAQPHDGGHFLPHHHPQHAPEANGNNGTNGNSGSSASTSTSGSASAAPLSGSYHFQSSRYSPQNSLTPQHSSLDAVGALAADAITTRPQTPGSGGASGSNDNGTHSNIPSAASGNATATAAKPSIDRTNDTVYTATTSVVKAIMVLSHGVERAVAADYLDLVKNVGFELRALLASVDQLSSVFPAQAHK